MISNDFEDDFFYKIKGSLRSVVAFNSYIPNDIFTNKEVIYTMSKFQQR